MRDLKYYDNFIFQKTFLKDTTKILIPVFNFLLSYRDINCFCIFLFFIL